MDAEELRTLLYRGFGARYELRGSGVLDSVQLAFTERGTATVVATLVPEDDGRVLLTAQYDQQGNLIELVEEN